MAGFWINGFFFGFLCLRWWYLRNLNRLIRQSFYKLHRENGYLKSNDEN